MQQKSNRRKRLDAHSLSACLIIVLVFLSLQAHAWDEQYYNPKPDENDVVLPMPCDGSLVFRKIMIPVSGPLEDYRILVGSVDAKLDYAEHTRPEYITGSFDETDGNSFFLMGKYEISRLQYAALMNDQCPKVSMEQRLPQAQINWFEAVDFSNRYNLWLRKNAKNKLPGRDDQLGFIRLPTEIEWEYAARGGMAVSASEFQGRRFPMTEAMARYVWFAGTQSANGEAQLIGMLEPNPLNLYDILGNVEEIVLEPFRLNKVNRLHGQAGSFIVKGGNFLTSQADIRSSMRQEIPYYIDTDLRKNKLTGFRVALGGAALTSLKRLHDIQAAWPKLGTEIPESKQPLLDKTALQNPVDELRTIADAATDPNMKRRLNNLIGVFKGSIEAQTEQRDRAALAALRLGSYLCRKLREDGGLIESRRKILRNRCEGKDPSRAFCETQRSLVTEQDAALHKNLNYYADTVTSTALEYNERSLNGQGQVLARTLKARGLKSVIPFLKRYRSHVHNFSLAGRIAREDWLADCIMGGSRL